MNGIKSILNGEAAGSLKFLVSFLLALTVWTALIILSGRIAQTEANLNSRQRRLHTLLMLGDEFRTLSPATHASGQSGQSGQSDGATDVASVFAQVSERMRLGNRVNRISPDGRNQSVEINRLYAEEFIDLQRRLSSRGVRFIAAELRALPAGSERLFTVTAIIGPEN